MKQNMSCAQHNAWHTARAQYSAAFKNFLELESSFSDSKARRGGGGGLVFLHQVGKNQGLAQLEDEVRK